ncbi:MAG: tetratricopeptide repeat protein [Planctomycetota bacterium]|nr:tetratricopeptide repeat protein [Planctomycetota bacterium]
MIYTKNWLLLSMLAMVVVLTMDFQVLHAQTKLDEMSLERWAKMREVERYQMNIAEKYYKDKKFDVAMSEYEKYLSLYEVSDAASFAQLKWSLCLNQLRKQNTAIKEGFQSVIDYWPESTDAAKASYLIGKTYVAIGRVPSGKSAYQQTISDYPKDAVAVYSLAGLAEIAIREKDEASLVKIWKRMAFDIPRTKLIQSTCATAANSLAVHYFRNGVFASGLECLESNYKDDQLYHYVYYYSRAPIGDLVAVDKTQSVGYKVADQTIGFLRKNIETDLSTEQLTAKALGQWYQIIEVQKYSRRDKEILAAYRTMLGLFGNRDDLLSSIADYHGSQKRYEQSRTIYRQFKDKVVGLSKVAQSFRAELKPDEAVVVYKQLAGIDAENGATWRGAEAATYREFRKYPQAILGYQALVKTDVANFQKWIWALATTQHEANQLKEAIGTYRQCENFPENYRQMAACHRALKQHKEALILYGQIVNGHEGLAPWAQLQIGYTYEAMTARELAIKAFQSCCKKYPKASYASTAHAHLQNKYKISVTLGGATDE